MAPTITKGRHTTSARTNLEPMDEIPLIGGRVTRGVVRIEETVRRPVRPNSVLVRPLLAHLAEREPGLAPRYLGTDTQGRETFSFLAGAVPDELDAGYDDATLAAAGMLIRRFHDATAGSPLAGTREVVCHGDLSPCNAVFRAGMPVALIDFDNAALGSRLDDLGYALFLWLNIGTDGPEPGKQARRIRVFCEAYGVTAGPEMVAAIGAAVARNIERLEAEGRVEDVGWWRAQLEWIAARRGALVDG